MKRASHVIKLIWTHPHLARKLVKENPHSFNALTSKIQPISCSVNYSTNTDFNVQNTFNKSLVISQEQGIRKSLLGSYSFHPTLSADITTKELKRYSSTKQEDTRKEFDLKEAPKIKTTNAKAAILTATKCISNSTQHQEINKILMSYTEGINYICNPNLVGIYLSGSLSYGNFNPNKSDIDLITISKFAINSKELKLIKDLHQNIGHSYEIWSNRLECSYINLNMLKYTLPPKDPRPYYNNNTFYDKAHYGNEWIIDKYLLYKYGIPIIGPPIPKLMNPVNITDTQIACIKNLHQEWAPKVTDSSWHKDSHYQVYIVLNLCRILYTIINYPTGSKVIAANWAKDEYGAQWKSLIESAEKWEYGKELDLHKEITLFIKFILEKAENFTNNPIHSFEINTSEHADNLETMVLGQNDENEGPIDL